MQGPQKQPALIKVSVDKCDVDLGNSDIVLVILEMSKIVRQNFDLKDLTRIAQ